MSSVFEAGLCYKVTNSSAVDTIAIAIQRSVITVEQCQLKRSRGSRMLWPKPRFARRTYCSSFVPKGVRNWSIGQDFKVSA